MQVLLKIISCWINNLTKQQGEIHQIQVQLLELSLPLPWMLCFYPAVVFLSVLFLPKFGCHGNSLGSLENLDSKFEFVDPKNPTIYAKIVLISCTEMKLWLYECFA